ncbi:MAG: hypothetical protein HQ521_10650 [Bacteroidetes bacterium]|nr:hypothetical protein [Bacteroidota bacterium]
MKKILIISLVLIVISTACKKDNESENPDSTSCNGVVCEPSLLADETSATLPLEIQGVFQTTYSYAEPTSPFSNGQKAKFTLTSNNELIIEIEGEECLTLKNPAFRAGLGESNYFFKDDCDRNICYSVSQTSTGVFNEVNVQPYEGAGWFGQFAQE